jgi:hypothetical protein
MPGDTKIFVWRLAITVWVRDSYSDKFTEFCSVLMDKQNSSLSLWEEAKAMCLTPWLAGSGLLTAVSTIFDPDDSNGSEASIISVLIPRVVWPLNLSM